MIKNSDNIVCLIYFDEHGIDPLVIVGYRSAKERFRQVSQQYNAHFFVKIESNSKDDPYFSSNAKIYKTEEEE